MCSAQDPHKDGFRKKLRYGLRSEMCKFQRSKALKTQSKSSPKTNSAKVLIFREQQTDYKTSSPPSFSQVHNELRV